MWFLFPRVRAGTPLARWVQQVRDLVRARKDWPLPKKPVPLPEPRRQAAEAVGLSKISGFGTVEGHAGDLLVILGDRDRVPGTRVEIRGVMPLTLQVEGIDTAIQARLVGASSGQLALAEPDGGHLALADGDGRITLDPREE